MKIFQLTALLSLTIFTLGAGGVVATNNRTAATPSHYGTISLNLPGTGWTQLIHEVGYPYINEVVQGITSTAQTLVTVDPVLLNDPITFYAVNAKKYRQPEHALLGSEYAVPGMIIFYNPNSPIVVANRSVTNTHSTGAPSTGSTSASDMERLAQHEAGHLKWSKMSASEKAAWTEIWELCILLDLDRSTVTYTKPDGTTARYCDIDAEEGFCEAWADTYTTDSTVKLDDSIKTYMKELPKSN